MQIATYSKLRSGEWGIRVQGPARKGQSLTVAKKSGETKTETVRNVMWSGNGITLCAIEQSSRRSSAQPRGRWTGCSCGSIEDHPRPSDCASCQHDY